jgi:hypothetical protein
MLGKGGGILSVSVSTAPEYRAAFRSRTGYGSFADCLPLR